MMYLYRFMLLSSVSKEEIASVRARADTHNVFWIFIAALAVCATYAICYLIDRKKKVK